MRKIVITILVICLCIGFCGCQKTDNINIEDFSAKHSVMYKESRYVAYYCEFENGKLTVDRNTYVDSELTDTGIILADTETTTYYYSLDGDNHITVDGVKYYYRAYQVAEYESYVEFGVPFLGIATKWKG